MKNWLIFMVGSQTLLRCHWPDKDLSTQGTLRTVHSILCYTEHVSKETSLIHITQAKLTDSQKTHSQKINRSQTLQIKIKNQILSC